MSWLRVLVALPLVLCLAGCGKTGVTTDEDISPPPVPKGVDDLAFAQTFCVDMAFLGLQRLPNVRDDIEDFPSSQQLYPHVASLCLCVAEQGTDAMFEHWATTSATAALFEDGMAGFQRYMRLTLDFGALYESHLQHCRDVVDLDALHALVYESETDENMCELSADGALGGRYGIDALMEVLFSNVDGDLFSYPPASFPEQRTNACLGTSTGTYGCDAQGQLSLALSPCALGCAEAACCDTDCTPEAKPLVSDPPAPAALADPECPPAPVGKSQWLDKPTPEVTLPTCDGTETSLASTFGAEATVIYYLSGW